MIPSLYKPFRHWAETGSIWILSDTHFDDKACKFLDENWLTPNTIHLNFIQVFSKR